MSVAPVSPMSMKSVARLATPWEFYWVLEQPAPLAGMAYPRSSPWQTLADEGFESVVCLTDTMTRYDPHPLKVLRAAKFKELYGGAYPDEAEAEQTALRNIVSAVRSEQKVLSSIAWRAPAGRVPSSPVLSAHSVFRYPMSSTTWIG